MVILQVAAAYVHLTSRGHVVPGYPGPMITGSSISAEGHEIRIRGGGPEVVGFARASATPTCPGFVGPWPTFWPTFLLRPPISVRNAVCRMRWSIETRATAGSLLSLGGEPGG